MSSSFLENELLPQILLQTPSVATPDTNSAAGSETLLRRPLMESYLLPEQSRPGLDLNSANNTSSNSSSTSSVSKEKKAAHACCFEGCSKSFPSRWKLVQHMRIHTGERPYQCTQCNKSFRIKDALRRHERIHKEEKLYKCTFEGCEKSFNTSTNLKYHLQTHTKEKPFVCDVPGCYKRFQTAFQLKQHQNSKTVHQNLESDSQNSKLKLMKAEIKKLKAEKQNFKFCLNKMKPHIRKVQKKEEKMETLQEYVNLLKTTLKAHNIPVPRLSNTDTNIINANTAINSVTLFDPSLMGEVLPEFGNQSSMMMNMSMQHQYLQSDDESDSRCESSNESALSSISHLSDNQFADNFTADFDFNEADLPLEDFNSSEHLEDCLDHDSSDLGSFDAVSLLDSFAKNNTKSDE